jgi:hypothetical protein
VRWNAEGITKEFSLDITAAWFSAGQMTPSTSMSAHPASRKHGYPASCLVILFIVFLQQQHFSALGQPHLSEQDMTVSSA